MLRGFIKETNSSSFQYVQSSFFACVEFKETSEGDKERLRCDQKDEEISLWWILMNIFLATKRRV